MDRHTTAITCTIYPSPLSRGIIISYIGCNTCQQGIYSFKLFILCSLNKADYSTKSPNFLAMQIKGPSTPKGTSIIRPDFKYTETVKYYQTLYHKKDNPFYNNFFYCTCCRGDLIRVGVPKMKKSIRQEYFDLKVFCANSNTFVRFEP